MKTQRQWFASGYQDALHDVKQRWDEGGPEAALKWIEDNYHQDTKEAP